MEEVVKSIDSWIKDRALTHPSVPSPEGMKRAPMSITFNNSHNLNSPLERGRVCNEQTHGERGFVMIPLAEQLRPKTLDEVVGQSHLVGKGKPMRKMLEQGKVTSMILWGPPGCGKTTLARLIAKYVDADFVSFLLSQAESRKFARLSKKQEMINPSSRNKLFCL